MADEFSTPINKIQAISTRDEGGKAEPVTYEDILRQQGQPEEDRSMHQPVQNTPSMQQPMPQQMQQPMPQQMQQPMMQPMMQQPMQMASYAHSDRGDDPGDYGYDMYDHPRNSRRDSRDTPDTRPSNASWFMTKLRRHKNDIIFALAMFATLTVIIPKLRNMSRFQEGIPMIVIGLVSVLMGSLANTVSLAL